MTRSGNLISKLQSSSLISLCWPVFPAVSPRPPSEWVPPEASLGTPDWAPWCRSRNSSENIPVSRKLQGVTWKFTSRKIISIQSSKSSRKAKNFSSYILCLPEQKTVWSVPPHSESRSHSCLAQTSSPPVSVSPVHLSVSCSQPEESK